MIWCLREWLEIWENLYYMMFAWKVSKHWEPVTQLWINYTLELSVTIEITIKFGSYVTVSFMVMNGPSYSCNILLNPIRSAPFWSDLVHFDLIWLQSRKKTLQIVWNVRWDKCVSDMPK